MKYKYQLLPQCPLNPKPTDTQLELFKHHKKAGTTPGNPKWYKPQIIHPFVFKEGLPAKMPYIETGAQWSARHSKYSASKNKPILFKYKDGTERVEWH